MTAFWPYELTNFPVLRKSGLAGWQMCLQFTLDSPLGHQPNLTMARAAHLECDWSGIAG